MSKQLSDWRVKIHFETTPGASTALTYRLYETSVTRKWWPLVHQTIPVSTIQHDGFFYGQLFDNEEFLSQELNRCIGELNSYFKANGFPEFIVDRKVAPGATQELLSELHVYFEKYAEDSRFRAVLREPLRDMNTYIHRMENFAGGEKHDRCGIDILFDPTMYVPFEMEDYSHFSLDWVWGQLYLTYGITGVPTINAFACQSEPRAQHCMCQGMLLGFYGDSVFKDHDKLRSWMESKGMDYEDPRWAKGYMPLGILEDPLIPKSDEERRELLLKVGQGRKIVNIELLGPKPKSQVALLASPPADLVKPHQKIPEVIPEPKVTVDDDSLTEARWPYDQEIFYHLDLVPYLDLGFEFDAKALFEEGMRAINYFVPHRDYDQESMQGTGKWKALGLRSLHGDWSKTQYHTSYQFEGKAIYQNTVFAQLCPKTMAFLNRVTDVEQCERVRFMLLEPGASIKTHRDSKDRDVSMAINISLNMPPGCDFWVDANADGTLNDYSRKVPFKDSGSVILFNNAKYHKVINDSDVPRLHIIFHGPIRFNDPELLALARKQNGIHSRKELLKTLLKKKAAQGESLQKTPMLQQDWVTSGLDVDSLPAEIRLLIVRHEGSNADASKENALNLVTIASLFPLSYTVVEEKDLDKELKKLTLDGVKTAAIISAGTMICHVNDFILELVKNSQRMIDQKIVALGHLMDFPEGGRIPYFHEQMMMLNVPLWKELDAPEIGSYFGVGKIKFPKHDRGENVHDDYTPRWLAPGNGVGARDGQAHWGSKLMARAIEAGLKIENIPDEIRKIKKYGYPRDNNQSAVAAREDIKKEISGKLDLGKSEVFFFNNEELAIPVLPNFELTHLISVSAGFKAVKILDQYAPKRTPKVSYVDFSQNALDYMKKVVSSKELKSLEKTIASSMKEIDEKKWPEGLAGEKLKMTVREFFDGNADHFMSRVQQMAKASFHPMNFVAAPEELAHLVSEGENFLIWVSNAFYNNHLYFLISKEEADRRYLELARLLAKRTRTRAFVFKGTRTVVFGKGLDFLSGMLTDGSVKVLSFVPSSWEEIRESSPHGS